MCPRPSFVARLMIRIVAVAVSAMVVTTAASAQVGTVTGRVTDAKSSAAISGAQIFVVGTMRSTTTREDGSYSIGLTAGTHTLRATKIGYAPTAHTVTVSTGATATQDFSLIAAPIGLDQVVVTGTRAMDRTVLEAPVPIDVLSSAEIQATGRRCLIHWSNGWPATNSMTM